MINYLSQTINWWLFNLYAFCCCMMSFPSSEAPQLQVERNQTFNHLLVSLNLPSLSLLPCWIYHLGSLVHLAWVISNFYFVDFKVWSQPDSRAVIISYAVNQLKPHFFLNVSSHKGQVQDCTLNWADDINVPNEAFRYSTIVQISITLHTQQGTLVTKISGLLSTLCPNVHLMVKHMYWHWL